MKKTSEIIFSAAILTLTFVIFICTIILPRQEMRANEIYTAPPSLFSDGINIYFFSELETYFSKNFAFRHEMITADAAVKSSVFASSGTDSVIRGKNGWLYYASTADDYLNNASISERDAADIAISLKLAGEYAEINGADFLFFVAPNKNSVYPDYMPVRYSPSDDKSSYDLLIEALENVGVNTLDLKAVFAEYDDTLYHRLDSHWNNTGAAIAEYSIMTALGREGTDYSAASYEIRTDFSADLYEMVFPSGKKLDEQRYYELPDITETGTSENISYSTACDTGTGTLLMYRDSFGNALAPIIAREFSNAEFSRSVPYDASKIKEYGADALVIELAERNIKNLKTRAIIFEAPERDIAVPDIRSDIGFSCKLTANNDLTCISGNIGIERDIGTPVYILADGVVFEASPVGDGENAFTAYLDYYPQSISLILTISGEQVITDCAISD